MCRIKRPVIGVILNFLLAPPVFAGGYTGNVAWREYRERPSVIIQPSANGPRKDFPSYVDTPIACYDDESGELLNCHYDFTIEGVDQGTDPQVAGETGPLTHIEIYGGHEHDYSTHPTYETEYKAQAPTQIMGGFFTRTGDLSVAGNTSFTWVDARFLAPETAGSIWTQLDVVSPPWTVPDFVDRG